MKQFLKYFGYFYAFYYRYFKYLIFCGLFQFISIEKILSKKGRQFNAMFIIKMEQFCLFYN